MSIATCQNWAWGKQVERRSRIRLKCILERWETSKQSRPWGGHCYRRCRRCTQSCRYYRYAWSHRRSGRNAWSYRSCVKCAWSYRRCAMWAQMYGSCGRHRSYRSCGRLTMQWWIASRWAILKRLSRKYENHTIYTDKEILTTVVTSAGVTLACL